MSYLSFSLLFLVAASVPAVLAVVARRTTGRWWLAVLVTAAALVALTVVFDSLMVSVDLFRYDQTRSLGVDVLLAPLEDLAWPVASALLLPALWALSDRRKVRSPEPGSGRRPAPRPRRPRRAAPQRR